MNTPIEIKLRMEELKNKWPEPPVKNSAEWWRYRADQSLYITLRSKLASLNKTK
jgi:hypothetical protein